jgi:O-antigen ligase
VATPQVALILLALSIGLLAVLFIEYKLPLALILIYVATCSTGDVKSYEVLAGSFGLEHIIRLSIGLCAFCLVAFQTIAALRFALFFGNLPILLFMFYLAFCLVSTVWSASPLVTFAKSFELATGFFVVLCSFYDSAQRRATGSLLGLFYFSMGFILFSLEVTFIGYFVDPTANTEYGIIGDTSLMVNSYLQLSSNGISRYGAMLSAMALAHLIDKNPKKVFWDGVLLVVGLFAQVMSVGRTGMASFALSALLLSMLRPRILILIAPVFAVLVFLDFDAIVGFVMRGQDVSEFEGLTGRIGWWEFAIDSISQAPFLGFGFGVGSRVVFQEHGVFETSSLHNGFLEVLTGVGLIGFLIWLAPFVCWIVSTMVSLIRGVRWEVNIMICPLLFSTFLSQGTGGWMSVDFGLYMIMLCLADQRFRPAAWAYQRAF